MKVGEQRRISGGTSATDFDFRIRRHSVFLLTRALLRLARPASALNPFCPVASRSFCIPARPISSFALRLPRKRKRTTASTHDRPSYSSHSPYPRINSASPTREDRHRRRRGENTEKQMVQKAEPPAAARPASAPLPDDLFYELGREKRTQASNVLSSCRSRFRPVYGRKKERKFFDTQSVRLDDAATTNAETERKARGRSAGYYMAS